MASKKYIVTHDKLYMSVDSKLKHVKKGSVMDLDLNKDQEEAYKGRLELYREPKTLEVGKQKQDK